MPSTQLSKKEYKVNVLVPNFKDLNPFFEEIVRHSKTTKYVFGNLDDDASFYDAVLIHWPELLFKRKEPSLAQIEDLNQTLNEWKKTTRIVHVVHNNHPHKKNTNNFKKLYDLVHFNADITVHLGEFSKDKYKKIYPNSKHLVIEHPLYASSMKLYDKLLARKKLGIKKNKFVIMVPGKIRTLEERKLVLSSFKQLKIKEKLLLVPRMFPLKMKPFKGYYKLKKILPIDKVYSYFANKEYVTSYNFNYSFCSNEQLSLLASSADVIFIPRLNNLNSGNTFLGLTFKKLILGPNNGNTAEFLKRHKMIKYDVNNLSAIPIKLYESYKYYQDFKINENEIQYLHPKQIAFKWDELFMGINRLSNVNSNK